MSKDNELLYGCAYYLEYMPTKDAVAHMTMMKNAGMNVVRIAESTWSTLEPRPGEFHFDHVDAMLAAANEVGMKVIIGTPTYAIPSWMAKLHPDINVPRKEGRVHYGHRQDMDITNPDYIFYAMRVVEELVSHVAENPAVIGYQVDNETKHYGTYSRYAQERFVKHLKKKFGTVENLNDAYHLEYWSNSISEWDDFPDMRGCINAGLSAEYEDFLRSEAAAFLKLQADIIRDYAKKGQFITHNLDYEWKKFGADISQDGYSYGVQPDMNHAEVAEFLDIAGTDIYHPTQDELTGAEIAFGGDEMRSLKNKNYIVLECQAQAFKYWTPFPGQLRQHAYSHVASGAKGVMYWNWQSIHNGFETYWRGVLSHDLKPNETYRDCVEIGREFNRIGEKLIIKKENKTALLVDNRSLTAYKWFPMDKDLSYNDVVKWMYDSLYEMNIECDVVYADKLDADKYKVIYVPAMYSVSEELISKLHDFVKNGGILISSFKSFVADRNLTVFHDEQPHGMTDVFGITYQSFTIPGDAKLMPASQWSEATELSEDDKKLEYFMELLQNAEAVPTVEGQFEAASAESEKATPKAAVLSGYEHRYWGRFGCISEHTYGKGRAYYVGAFITKNALKKLYSHVYEKAGITLPKLTWPITIRQGINEDDKKLNFIFNYSTNHAQVKLSDVITDSKAEKYTDLITGNEFDINSEIELSDWGVIVLSES